MRDLISLLRRLPILESIVLVLTVGFLFFASPNASATDMVARQGDDTVRLTDKPCTNPDVVKLIPPDVVKDFHAASAVFQGKSYQACWRPYGNTAAMIYEDGDGGFVPFEDLKPAMEV